MFAYILSFPRLLDLPKSECRPLAPNSQYDDVQPAWLFVSGKLEALRC